MQGKFICHKDFENLKPIDVFHKEFSPKPVEKHSDVLCNRHTLFRKKVFLQKPQNALLKITADDYFKLYINDTFVTQGPPPSYPQHYYYMEIDVTPYLKDGVNTFAVHTYYQGLINRVFVSGDLRSMFWCVLSLDGETVLATDESWLAATHTGYSSCGIFGYETAFAECYNSNAPEIGFEREDFDDSAWQSACVYKNADYTLETPTHTESYMRFDGWKDGEGNTIAITGKWTTDSGMTLTAQWTDTRETYTISFVQAGQATKTFSVKEGEDFTEIPTPVAKTGYTIVWDKTDFTNVQESMTVTAQYTANTYTITYDVNGGSALTETTQKVTYDEAYTVKDAPTKSGYTFKGWYIKGTDTKFENGTWTTDGDVAVEARWEKLPEEEWTKNY